MWEFPWRDIYVFYQLIPLPVCTWNIMCNSNYAVSEEDRIQGKKQYGKSKQR